MKIKIYHYRKFVDFEKRPESNKVLVNLHSKTYGKNWCDITAIAPDK